jgi:hypothetical protein
MRHSVKNSHPAPAALRQLPTLRPALVLTLALLTTALPGCTFPTPHPPEYLDPDTAALVTTVNSPIIFARTDNDVAANARQYATVAAVSVNRSGRYEYVLLVYLWSTLDPRLGIDRHPGQNIILLADDRAIRLIRDSRSMHEVGISTPLHAPEHIRGQPRIYRTDHETLQFLAKATRVRLLLEGDEDPRPFDIWTDGRRALAQFASATK